MRLVLPLLDFGDQLLVELAPVERVRIGKGDGERENSRFPRRGKQQFAIDSGDCTLAVGIEAFHDCVSSHRWA